MNIGRFQNHCCGCGECYAVCPTHAISMKANIQGFYYPAVDLGKCIDCSKCVQYCSFNAYRSGMERNVISTYALKHNRLSVREASRSGGVFTALSDVVLTNGGVVYGCKLVDSCEAVHGRATTEVERNEFRGSKYIQSDIKGVYSQILSDLKEDRWVLFSGTPCQVDAISRYCKGYNTEKLLLIDIVCYGVPSQKVWKDYLSFVRKKNGNRPIKSVDFRDKKLFGWAAHKESIQFCDGTVHSGSCFRQLFNTYYILRKECFECPYKNLQRTGDISIADCWGVAEHYPEFDDNRGVSLVLVNSSKGQKIFEEIKDVERIDVDLSKLMQPCLKENWKKPDEYEQFWKYYTKHTFKQVIEKYIIGKELIWVRFNRKIRIIGSRVKSVLIRKRIKKI